MLRIVPLPNAAAAKGYYASSDYYLGDGQELPGVWGGLGARRLGLTPGEEIDRTAFDRLCDNRRPLDGEPLTPHDKANRRVGYDFNFHAPKSVTLAYELGGDDRVLDAFRDAVGSAMEAVERDVQTRVRVGGADGERVTGEAVFATFVHRTARPVEGIPDPHLHAHAVVFNATYDPVEGKFKAADVADVKRHGGFYEALFHARLAADLVELGYGVERRGKFWEIAGADPTVLARYSRRTAVVEQAAREAGITDAEQKGELGAKTRERKADHLSPARLRALWHDRLTDAEATALAEKREAAVPLPEVAESVRFALDHAFEREAVVSERAVLEHALRHGVGRITLPELRAEASHAGLLTRDGRATTRELLDAEADTLRFARDGRAAVPPLCEAFRPTATTLTRDQRNAVAHILTRPDRVTLVVGAAGTGKTTALEKAAAAIRASGRPVAAVAVTHTAAKELAAVDPTAGTLASFLANKEKRAAVRGGVVIVDEASQIGTRDVARLFRVLEANDTRVVLVGDPKQHPGVAAGNPFVLLQTRGGLDAARMSDIVRQTRDDYRAACRRLAAHDTLAGLDLLEELGAIVEIQEPDERFAALAADYAAAVRDGQSVLVVAPTHREADEATARIRGALRSMGKLDGEERTVPRLVNLNWTEAERTEARRPGTPQAELAKSRGLVLTRYGAYWPDGLALAVGDQIRATAGFRDAAGKKVDNGTRFTVTGFDRSGGIRVTTATGVARTLPMDARHLAHDYVRTSFSSQSRTADVVLIAESSGSLAAADRAQMYVSASRGRTGIRVFTDAYPLLRSAVDRDRVKASATDLFPPAEIAEPAAPPRHRVREATRWAERLRAIARTAAEWVRRGRHRTRGEYAHDRGRRHADPPAAAGRGDRTGRRPAVGVHRPPGQPSAAGRPLHRRAWHPVAVQLRPLVPPVRRGGRPGGAVLRPPGAAHRPRPVGPARAEPDAAARRSSRRRRHGHRRADRRVRPAGHAGRAVDRRHGAEAGAVAVSVQGIDRSMGAALRGSGEGKVAAVALEPAVHRIRPPHVESAPGATELALVAAGIPPRGGRLPRQAEARPAQLPVGQGEPALGKRVVRHPLAGLGPAGPPGATGREPDVAHLLRPLPVVVPSGARHAEGRLPQVDHLVHQGGQDVPVRAAAEGVRVQRDLRHFRLPSPPAELPVPVVPPRPAVPLEGDDAGGQLAGEQPGVEPVVGSDVPLVLGPSQVVRGHGITFVLFVRTHEFCT